MSSDNKFSGYNSIFATRLRELMANHKTTQKELAEIVGTTRQAISQYADGSVQPNLEKLYKISSYYKVSSDWLIGKNDIKSPDIDNVAINKKLGLSQDSIEYLSFLVEYYNMTPPIENALKTINFLLEDANGNKSTQLLSDIAEYFYDTEMIDMCKKAHYHLDNLIDVGEGGKETDLGEHIIFNILREEDVLNMLLLQVQKSLVKSMEHIRNIEPDAKNKETYFGSFNIKKDGDSVE